MLREFRLNDEWYIKPTEKDGRGWGATEAIRGALCHWIEVQSGKIKNYQIIAPTTWNVGPRAETGERGPIEEALIGTPIKIRMIRSKSAMWPAPTIPASFAPFMPMTRKPAKNLHDSERPECDHGL